MELIKLHDIYKTYRLGEVDVPVLKGVSLAVERGELVALMGASGSGKSTLMNILGCLDRPTSGEYWLDGEEISKLSSDERAHVRNTKIGFVFQSFNLLARTSALENVMMPLTYAPRAVSERESRRRATELLELVGLADRAHHYPSQLSGGQQQRVAIARALAMNPRGLLCDEITSALDPELKHEVLEVLEVLKAEGLTLIVVTHEMGFARRCADRVCVLAEGRILEEGPPESVLENPQHERTQRFLRRVLA